MIPYDDFKKLEITIGEIKAVDIVADADKLLRITVDVGEQGEDGGPVFRQVVSGIREYVNDPQALVGTKCPFLTNLEHRTIRGYESEAMILAAHHDDTFALLLPSTDLPNGTRVV